MRNGKVSFHYFALYEFFNVSYRGKYENKLRLKF